MNLKEFYKEINGNYEDVLLRLPTDDFIKRFVRRFVVDKSFFELESAIAEKKIKESFEASHKLKGIAANLGFSELYEHLVVLTNQLRPFTDVADETLYQNVKNSYEKVISCISKLED